MKNVKLNTGMSHKIYLTPMLFKNIAHMLGLLSTLESEESEKFGKVAGM